MLPDTLGNMLMGIAAVLTQLVGMLALYLTWKRDLKKQNQFIDHSVRKLNGIASAIIQSFESPAWLKACVLKEDGTTEFRIVETNSEFEQRFNLDRLESVGKTDLEAGWSRPAAYEFLRGDLQVWSTGIACTLVHDVDGRRLSVRRVRVQSDDGDLKGVMCYVVDDNHVATSSVSPIGAMP